MAKIITAHCSRCNKNFEGKLSKNLAGFPKIKCPKCGEKILYPLGKVYKSIYWIIVGIVLVEIIYDLAVWDIESLLSFSIAGIALIIVSIYGLLKDRQIRKKSK